MFRMRLTFLCLMTALMASACVSLAADDQGAEAAVRALVRANAEKDIQTLSRLMAHDADITSYTIGGRKYVGWPDFEVSPDGTKFLAIVPGPANQQPLTAVINFLEQAATRSGS